MQTKDFLDRPEAAEYLTERGLRTTKTTLQKYATIGGGPPYQRFGHRAVYTRSNLDAWAESKLTALRCTAGAKKAA